MIYEDAPLKPSNYAIFRWFGFDQFVPERSVTSYWVSSKTFFIIRFIITLYSTVVLWTNIGVSHSGYFFMFFTSLTFIGLHAYLVTSLVHHFRYLYSKNISFFIHQYTALNYLYLYLYSTVVTFNIVTPVVYWALLASGATANPLSTWLNVSMHGVSFFLMLFDVIFNRIKLPIRMVIFPLITIIAYMLLAFIIYASEHFWVYPFLNWNQGPVAALWYFVVGIICVVAFFIQILIHWIRDRIARKTTVGEEAPVEKMETDDLSYN